ncbi:hypothetical protein BHE74_00006977 [Ensete ventricosum]|nr:hypothetical protein BHE74_00006977 [Ensete ventricosum]RZR79495.1 hypothetical protein BHM03_00005225 [Ensete ventricosum]
MKDLKMLSTVMDLNTGASLVQGLNKDNIYKWLSVLHLSKPITNSIIDASADVWYRHLSHP